MKFGAQSKILAGLVLLVVTTILSLVLSDKCETYDPWSYIQALWSEQEDLIQPLSLHGRVQDKIIVVAKLKKEDVSWITEDLAE